MLGRGWSRSEITFYELTKECEMFIFSLIFPFFWKIPEDNSYLRDLTIDINIVIEI